MNIEKKMNELYERVEKYSYYYYTRNESLISDVEFDKLLAELERLEEENPELKREGSLTSQVGSSLKDSKFTKVKHKNPMLSLSNTYNTKDLEDFDGRVRRILGGDRKVDYALELKLDGVSISVHYDKGKLVRAVTRGDGAVGEDVTENIMQISSIPHYLKEEVSMEVRGEIVLPIDEFKRLNEARAEAGDEVFANPRNAASGTLKQLDATVVKDRNLDCYFFFLVDGGSYGIEKHNESLEYLEKLGIKTTGVCEVCSSIQELEERIGHWQGKKEELNYETDGMVIKINDAGLWEELGATTKSPRWAIAYKFPAKQVTTKLTGVTWQVGRTGKVTPVAELEEVEVSGSKVKRASLHNYDEILRKDIRVGDRVFIEKAAEIIPQVVKVVKEVRDGSEKEIELPTTCPVCSSLLDNVEKSVDYVDAITFLGIEKVGEKKAKLLAEASGSIERLMEMELEELESIKTIGKRLAKTVYEYLRDNENIELINTLKGKGVSFSFDTDGVRRIDKREFAGDPKLLDFVSKDDVVDIRCINDDCPSKLQTKIEYFVSRDAMNIDGLGTKIVEKFIELGKIKDVSDIYKLHLYRAELEQIDKMGERSIENLINSIEESKKRDYTKTLYALGIPHVGKFLAKLLATESGSLENLKNMSREELLNLDGVGAKVAESVYSYLRNENHLEMLARLASYGINYEIGSTGEGGEENSRFTGKNFLFTGKLQHFGRSEIKEVIEELGGNNLSGVTKKLDYLIVGEKAGSKLKKAQELGTVEILTEEEFLKLIKGGSDEETQRDDSVKEEKKAAEDKPEKLENKKLF